MSPTAEKRLLQAAMAVTLALPLFAAISGVVRGPAFLDHFNLLTNDLDSHFRYLNGIFLALLCWYAACIPHIERTGPWLRILSTLVVTGGAMRALSWITVGPPSLGHKIGLVIELGIVPLVVLWQKRVARRMAA